MEYLEVLSPDEEVIHEQNKKIERLQKQLDIAVKALKEYATNESYKLCIVYYHYGEVVHASDVAQKALKEIDLVGASMSLAKEEQ